MRSWCWVAGALGLGVSTLGAFEFEMDEPVELKGPVPVWPHFDQAPRVPLAVVSRETYQIFFWSGPSTYRSMGSGVLSLQPAGLPVFGEGTRAGVGRLLAPQWRREGQWTALWVGEAGVAKDSGEKGANAGLPTTTSEPEKETDAGDAKEQLGTSPERVKSSAGGIHLAGSDDEGRTWSRDGLILSPPEMGEEEKEATPERAMDRGLPWLVRAVDPAHWFCLVPLEGGVMVARSEAEIPAVGTWQKWDGEAFTSEGLGGAEHRVDLGPHGPVEGLSVHLNLALKQWIMVWHREADSHGAGGGLWLSHSADLVRWSAPRVLVAAAPGERMWHPSIFGMDSRRAGETAVLVYGFQPADSSARSGPVMRTVRWIQHAIPTNETGRLFTGGPPLGGDQDQAGGRGR